MAMIVGTGRETDRTDEAYYQVAPPRSLGERLAIAARDRIYDDMIRHCRPDRSAMILDVGVSDIVTDAANMLERKYPHPERITAAGLSEGLAFRAAYPKVAYRRIKPNKRLPFASKTFDLAVSNAVLEHVGSEANQAAFVRELVRVAKCVFISVPNRYFPVEHHTMIPLLHFWRSGFKVACRALGKAEWADERNLILMSWNGLAALAPAGTVPAIGRTGIALGPFSSNLFLSLQTRTGGVRGPVRSSPQSHQVLAAQRLPPI